jgi:hypothetical protein
MRDSLGGPELPPMDLAELKILVLERYLKGEIDATAAAHELRALPVTGADYEYVLCPEGPWSDTDLRSKLLALGAAMDDES